MPARGRDSAPLAPARKKSARKRRIEHIEAGLCRGLTEDGVLCPEPASAVPVLSARLARACDEETPEKNWSGDGDRMCPTHAAGVVEMWLAEMWHPEGAPADLFVDRHGTEWWSPVCTVALVGGA